MILNRGDASMLRRQSDTGYARIEGYQAGYSDGYRYGSCESVLRLHPQTTPQMRNLKVLLIPQGFESIDTGVIYGFQSLVRELFVGSTHEMLRLAEMARPDLVLVLNGMQAFPDNHLPQIDAIRELGIRTAIWFVDDPYNTDYASQIAPHYDYVFSSERSSVQLYHSLGSAQAYHLPLAVSTGIYHPSPGEANYQSDVCFIGNAFPNRISFFDQVLPYLEHLKVTLVGSMWDRLSDYSQFADSIRLGSIPMEEVVRYYNGAKIVVNLHRSATDSAYNKNTRGIQAQSANLRTFEIAACGAFQLTDTCDDLPALYTKGTEIETFGPAHEFLRKVDYYLLREGERLRIALHGLRRTLTDHLMPGRLNQLLATIFDS